MAVRYSTARRDYERLKEIHGGNDVYDFTGGFGFEESGMELMQEPTTAKAREIYISLIDYGFSTGFDDGHGGRVLPEFTNPEIHKIAKRYHIDPPSD
jgi:hypothetical protein